MAHMKRNLGRALAGTLILSLVGMGTLAHAGDSVDPATYYHQLWIYPDDGNRMILGGDQGAVISVDGLADHPTWTSWLNQSIAEIYRVAPDYNVPYWVTGAQQDSGAVRVRSRGKFASITMRDWEPLCAGGESGYTAPDPRHR